MNNKLIVLVLAILILLSFSSCDTDETTNLVDSVTDSNIYEDVSEVIKQEDRNDAHGIINGITKTVYENTESKIQTDEYFSDSIAFSDNLPPVDKSPVIEETPKHDTSIIDYEDKSIAFLNSENESEEITADATNCDYVLNTNSMKFHFPSCSSVDNMAAHNKKYFIGTRNDAIAIGYDSCGRCKP